MKLYTIAVKTGVLHGKYARNQFDVCSYALYAMQDMNTDRIVTMRKAVQEQSNCGGQGFVKCMCGGCKRCQTNCCSCFKSKMKCNSRCHSSLTCKNKQCVCVCACVCACMCVCVRERERVFYKPQINCLFDFKLTRAE